MPAIAGRQTAGERRDCPGLRIDARDPAGDAFGDVQRAAGADGAARRRPPGP